MTCEGDTHRDGDGHSGGVGAATSEQVTTSTREQQDGMPDTTTTSTSTVLAQQRGGQPDVIMDAATNMPAATLLAPPQDDGLGTDDGRMQTEGTVSAEEDVPCLSAHKGSECVGGAGGGEAGGVSAVVHDGCDDCRDDGAAAFVAMQDGSGGMASADATAAACAVTKPTSAETSLAGASMTGADALIITSQTTTVVSDSLMMMSTSTTVMGDALITPALPTMNRGAVTDTCAVAASSPLIGVPLTTTMLAANDTLATSSSTSTSDDFSTETVSTVAGGGSPTAPSEMMHARDSTMSTSDVAMDLAIPSVSHTTASTVSDTTVLPHHDDAHEAVAHAGGSHDEHQAVGCEVVSGDESNCTSPSTHLAPSTDGAATTNTGVSSDDACGATVCSAGASSCSASVRETSADACVDGPFMLCEGKRIFAIFFSWTSLESHPHTFLNAFLNTFLVCFAALRVQKMA